MKPKVTVLETKWVTCFSKQRTTDKVYTESPAIVRRFLKLLKELLQGSSDSNTITFSTGPSLEKTKYIDLSIIRKTTLLLSLLPPQGEFYFCSNFQVRITRATFVPCEDPCRSLRIMLLRPLKGAIIDFVEVSINENPFDDGSILHRYCRKRGF